MKYYIASNGTEKEVSKKHYDKIISMDGGTQKFFIYCNDLDLNKKYKVAQFELMIKGIDLLTILDLMVKERDYQMKGIAIKGGLYFSKQNNCDLIMSRFNKC